MSEFSQLSKEEQEVILRMRKKMSKPKELKTPQSSSKESTQVSLEICKYVAGKGGKEKCADRSETPYGFCKKHSRTVQAKKAREEYEINECTTSTCSTTPSEGKNTQEISEKINPLTKEAPKKTKKQSAPVKEETPRKRVTPAKGEAHVPKKFAKQSVLVEEQPKKITKKPTSESQSLHKEVIRSKKIHPNHWGRFEDPVTHIVFDKNTKEAYGIQEPSGKVSALKQEHIQICIKNKWNYNLPYASDDEDEESIHDSDFDEDDDEEISESEEESLESSSEDDDEDDDEGEDVDGLVDSEESSDDGSDEELVNSDEESQEDDSDEESQEDDSDEESYEDDSDDSR